MRHKAEAFLRKYSKWSNLKGALADPNRLPFFALVALALELVLNCLIVERVPYTEIDWKAYMQETEGFLNGTLDYSQLKGDTGPLVYPAGFVYLYSLLYFVTGHGRDVKTAQYIFVLIYLAQLFFALRIYRKTLKVPPYVLLLSVLTSYRIHSIYALRLFNDPLAVLALFVSLNLFIDGRRTLGSALFSLGVSVKMNILLSAPALLLFYLTNMPLADAVRQLAVCAAVQLLLGLPFLATHPVPYVRGAFDLGRVFNHTWTVNYRFLDEEVFVSKYFHSALLCLHLLLLLAFYPLAKTYFESHLRLKHVQAQIQPQIDAKNAETERRPKRRPGPKPRKNERALTDDEKKFLGSYESSLKAQSAAAPRDATYRINFDTTNQLFVLPFFLCNFIGVVCARSLHYQFYSWYFHTLPYLLWCTKYSNIVRFLILALIELCWNTYPSTSFSSILLHACHVAILIGIYNGTARKS